MDTIAKQNSSTAEISEATNLVLRKLGQPVMTNLYYNTVKALLERASSVMIDSQALKVCTKSNINSFQYILFFCYYISHHLFTLWPTNNMKNASSS